MTRRSDERLRSLLCGAAVLVLSGVSLLLPLKSRADDKPAPPWVAPSDARAVKNPLKKDPKVVSAGLESFQENCQVCHGIGGEGNGPTAKSLTIKPANFTDPKVMSKETDGSLFWKMSKGRGAMPAWEDQLSETERWQLVVYIRSLAGKAPGAKKPE
jgi:mono/diheme cytochrome c family protein